MRCSCSTRARAWTTRAADQRTRLDDAKKRAEELPQRASAGSRVEIRTTTDRPGEAIRQTRTDAEVRARIKELEIAVASPPSTSAPVIGGFKELADVAVKRDDEAARKMPRLLCIFTDTTRRFVGPGPDLGGGDGERPGAADGASRSSPPGRSWRTCWLRGRRRPTRSPASSTSRRISSSSTNASRVSARPTSRCRPIPPIWSGKTRRSIREALRSVAEGKPDDKDTARWENSLRKTLHTLSGQETLWFDVGMNPLNDVAIVRIDWPERDGEAVETFAPEDDALISVVVEAAGHDVQTTLTCEHEAGKITRTIDEKAGRTVAVPFDLHLAKLKLGPGFHSLTFSLDVRDGWLGNNRRFATFQIREPKKILVVSDRPEKERELQDAASLDPHRGRATASPSRPRSRLRWRRSAPGPERRCGLSLRPH